MKSIRADKRGHWPRGRNRNMIGPKGDPMPFIRRLLRVGLSRRTIARETGADMVSIRKWLKLRQRPCLKYQQALWKLIDWVGV